MSESEQFPLAPSEGHELARIPDQEENAIVKQMVQDVAIRLDVDAPLDEKGQTPLMRAVIKVDIVEVRRLIALGADVNTKSKNDWTALMYGSQWGLLEIVEVLLNAGADINAKLENGKNALAIAITSQSFLFDINGATIEGHSDVVEVLLKRGANANERNAFGDTALIAAASQGDVETVKHLINAGADVNVVSFNAGDSNLLRGATALKAAAAFGHTDIVEVLIEAGAKVEKEPYDKGEYWARAIDHAKLGGHHATVEALKRAGAFSRDDQIALLQKKIHETEVALAPHEAALEARNKKLAFLEKQNEKLGKLSAELEELKAAMSLKGANTTSINERIISLERKFEEVSKIIRGI